MMEFVRYHLGIEAPDRNFDSALQVVLDDLNVLRGEDLFMPSFSALDWISRLS
ncbi:hypothetical protein [Microvirga lotononidis]|nr:hypothetical protein [Microvirga lotononidis]WQO31877.1 hypothetical protein U0023_31525 [Microvirga lotononidis]